MTSPTTQTIHHIIRDAIQHRHPIWITYHGLERLICPHALGWKTNRLLLLGYQTGGQTTNGTLDPNPNKRWRCMYLDHIDHATPTEPASPWQTPDNYNPTHPFPAIDSLITAI